MKQRLLWAYKPAKVGRYNILILDRRSGIHSAWHLTFTVCIFVQARLINDDVALHGEGCSK